MPSRVFATTLPSSDRRLKSSSHHPKRKSRAMSLNQGVKELAGLIGARHHSNEVSEGERGIRTRIVEHGLQFLLAHVLVITDLVGIWSNIDVAGHEKDVVHCTRVRERPLAIHMQHPSGRRGFQGILRLGSVPCSATGLRLRVNPNRGQARRPRFACRTRLWNEDIDRKPNAPSCSPHIPSLGAK